MSESMTSEEDDDIHSMELESSEEEDEQDLPFLEAEQLSSDSSSSENDGSPSKIPKTTKTMADKKKTKKRRKSTTSSMNLICTACHMGFDSSLQLEFHKTTYKHQKAMNPAFIKPPRPSSSIPSEAECTICKYTFTSAEALKVHNLTKKHLKATNPELARSERTCDVCNRTFSSITDLERHYSTKKHLKAINPESKSDRTCDVCNKTYSSRKELEKHKRTSKKHARRVLALNKPETNSRLELMNNEKAMDLSPTKSESNEEATEAATPTPSTSNKSLLSPPKKKKVKKSKTPKSKSTPENPKPTCTICQTTFCDNSSLLRHFKSPKHAEAVADPVTTMTILNVKQNFSCAACCITYDAAWQLNRHCKTLKHAVAASADPTSVPSPKRTSAVLIKKRAPDILVRKKSPIKMRSCSVCQTSFASPHEYKRHLSTLRHAAAAKATTPGPTAMLVQQSKSHVEKSATNKNTTCTTCQITFSRSSHLIRHYLSLTHALKVGGGDPTTTTDNTSVQVNKNNNSNFLPPETKKKKRSRSRLALSTKKRGPNQKTPVEMRRCTVCCWTFGKPSDLAKHTKTAKHAEAVKKAELSANLSYIPTLDSSSSLTVSVLSTNPNTNTDQEEDVVQQTKDQDQDQSQEKENESENLNIADSSSSTLNLNHHPGDSDNKDDDRVIQEVQKPTQITRTDAIDLHEARPDEQNKPDSDVDFYCNICCISYHSSYHLNRHKKTKKHQQAETEHCQKLLDLASSSSFKKSNGENNNTIDKRQVDKNKQEVGKKETQVIDNQESQDQDERNTNEITANNHGQVFAKKSQVGQATAKTSNNNNNKEEETPPTTNNNAFKCKICATSYDSIQELRIHAASDRHKINLKYNTANNKGSSSSASNNNNNQHIMNNTTPKSGFPNNLTPRQIINSSSTSLMSTPNGNGMDDYHYCHICKLRYSSSSNLKRHQRDSSLHLNNLKCINSPSTSNATSIKYQTPAKSNSTSSLSIVQLQLNGASSIILNKNNNSVVNTKLSKKRKLVNDDDEESEIEVITIDDEEDQDSSNNKPKQVQMNNNVVKRAKTDVDPKPQPQWTKCKYCTRVFTNPIDAQSHMNSTHTNNTSNTNNNGNNSSSSLSSESESSEEEESSSDEATRNRRLEEIQGGVEKMQLNSTNASLTSVTNIDSSKETDGQVLNGGDMDVGIDFESNSDVETEPVASLEGEPGGTTQEEQDTPNNDIVTEIEEKEEEKEDKETSDKEVSESQVWFNCKYCPRAFIDKSVAVLHVRSTHTSQDSSDEYEEDEEVIVEESSELSLSESDNDETNTTTDHKDKVWDADDEASSEGG